MICYKFNVIQVICYGIFRVQHNINQRNLNPEKLQQGQDRTTLTVTQM